MEIGDRVTTILNINDTTVETFGEGVFDGYSIPEGAVGCKAELALNNKCESPRIKLDQGGVVFGCECWFGPPVSFGERKVEKAILSEWRAFESHKHEHTGKWGEYQQCAP